MVELAGATVDMSTAEAWKNGEKQTLTAKEMQPGRSIHLLRDNSLLRRMLDNLIHNNITHNPQGCTIALSAGEENGRCLCIISDDEQALLRSG